VVLYPAWLALSGGIGQGHSASDLHDTPDLCQGALEWLNALLRHFMLVFPLFLQLPVYAVTYILLYDTIHLCDVSMCCMFFGFVCLLFVFVICCA
jgi:hypothetical protein